MEQNTMVYLLFPPLLPEKQHKITNMDSTGTVQGVGVDVLGVDAKGARSLTESSERDDSLWAINSDSVTVRGVAGSE
jgi:hypothetical protein